MSDLYTRDMAPVLEAERQRILAHRRARGIADGPTTGLALSGGGIRSASFALGLLQALDKADLLRRIDYLSTVSGGGFIGSALTWFRRDDSSDFPFGKPECGVRTHDDPGAQALAYLRQHGDYLNPSAGFDRHSFEEDALKRKKAKRGGVPFASLVAVTLRAAFLGTAIYGSLLVATFFVMRSLDRTLDLFDPLLLGSFPSPLWKGFVGTPDTPLVLGLLAIGVLMLLWLVYPFRALRSWPAHIVSFFTGSEVPDRSDDKARAAYRSSLYSQKWTGRVMLWGVGALVVGSVPIVARAITPVLDDVFERGLAAIISMTVGGVLGLSSFQSDRSREGAAPASALASIFAAVRSYAAGGLLLYGLLMLSYQLASAFDNYQFGGMIVPIVVLALLAGYFADANHVGIARMYRDRLMEAFMPGAAAVANNHWRPAVQANTAQISEMCSAEGPGPYHLINANVITTGSQSIRYRARGGDSFVLSPLYCGSDATGWRATGSWLREDLTLATCMAISAAAANPNAGVSGQGPTRNPFVSSVMSLLGLRLGYWVSNPNPELGGAKGKRANYLIPGLKQGVLGAQLDEHGSFLELSDGGHFENLGVYELIRRRVDVIIGSDAGADASYVFDGLAILTERVRVDFGVEIYFKDDEFDLHAVLPGSVEDDDPGRRYEQATRGFAVGTIHYPAHGDQPEKLGTLLYVKPTMVDDLPPDVISYKLQNADFPQQSTAQQFFGEIQLEAYRELGLRIGLDLAAENATREKQVVPYAEDPGRGAWL